MGDDGVVTGKYWFDNNSVFTTFSPGQFEVPTDRLPDGLHILNAFVVKDGISSATSSRWFVKTGSLSSASSSNVHLSIDGRPFDVIKCVPNGDVVSLNVDMTNVREGIHQLDARVDINGSVSSTASSWFVKSLFLRPGENYTTTLFLDGMPWNSFESQASANGLISLMLDMNSVSLGLHSLKVQVVSPSGVATSIKETMFMRMPSTEQLATLRGYYVIDNLIRGDIETAMDGNTFHIDVDASALASGLHSVSVYLSGVVGLTTPVKTAWFVKIPNGGEGVKSYEYWLNDNYEDAKTATLDKVENPFSLVTLMDIAPEPFRSSRYTFAIENGSPVVYAKNDLQMRFSDPEGRITMSSKPFTDVRVKHTVDEIKPIEGQSQMTIPSIADNEIKWFSFNAEAGDSLSLRLDRGAMYEVYSPNADLIVANSGAEAVNNSGLILKETGTYYLAVHDITAYDKNNLQVYFQHIPRFALLSNTPAKAANKGFLVMDIHGNGFDQIKSIHLEANDGAALSPMDYNVIDRYNMAIMFNLDSIKPHIGIYDLVAQFDKEGTTHRVVAKGAIELKDKFRAEIRTEVVAPRIARTPYEVYIDIINDSEQAAWGIPVNLAVTHSVNGMAIEFKDFFPCPLDTLETLPQTFILTDNLLGTGESGVMFPTILPYLGPNETRRLTIGLTTGPHDIIRMYAWNGIPWSDEFEDMFSDDYDFEQINDLKQENYLSAKALVYFRTYVEEYLSSSTPSKAPLKEESFAHSFRRCNNAANNVANVSQATGMAMGGIVNGMRLHNLNATLDAYGVDLSDETFSSLSNYQNDLRSAMPTPGSIVATALGYGDEYAIAQQYMQGCSSCPNPMPDAHLIDCYQSGDPNDMTGYISPSGDNYIGIDVKSVNYTIEFENDPKIANASASTIKVDNTVDGKTLDLASFKPLSLRIGDKETDLPAEHHFVKTLDMRPAINAVAELTFDYDAETGDASWSLRSLDPMTMETTKYMDDGILPVNDDSGKGIGYLTYSINLIPGLADGTEISNSASIVFDDNEPISTPVWTNVTDYVKPSAKIVSQVPSDDNKSVNFVVEGSDNRSGIWYYDLYMRKSGAKGWTLVRSQIEEDEFTYESTDAIGGASFTVIATDKAGNRQDNSLLASLPGDADGNCFVDVNDVVVTYNYYTGKSTKINTVNADVTLDGTIDAQDATYMINMYVDKTKARIRKRIEKSSK